MLEPINKIALKISISWKYIRGKYISAFLLLLYYFITFYNKIKICKRRM